MKLKNIFVDLILYNANNLMSIAQSFTDAIYDLAKDGCECIGEEEKQFALSVLEAMRVYNKNKYDKNTK